MPWFRVDDGFYSSRKVTQIPRTDRWPAIGLWTIAGTWSAKELTDGFVPDYQLEELGGRVVDADNLVRVGLWVRVDGGYEFSNWGEYQPTKAEIEAQREKEAERKRKWRESRESQRESRGTDAGRDAGHQQASGHPDPTRPDPALPITTDVVTVPDRFDEFWEKWPRKVDKPAAQRAWKKAVKKIPAQRLVELTAAYASHPYLPEKAFIPNPATWLNGERWNDDPPPPRDNVSQLQPKTDPYAGRKIIRGGQVVSGG